MFMTNLSTLQSSSSALAKMFDSSSSSYQLPSADESGAFFIDSSPDMFRYVLDWCRYKQLLVDSEYRDWNSLMVVADYFGLEEMRHEVRMRWDREIERDRKKT